MRTPPSRPSPSPCFVAQLPDTVWAGHCLAALDNDPTCVCLVAFPHQKQDHGLWLELLKATGVDPELMSMMQDGDRARTLVRIRMDARSVKAIIIFHAQHLNPQKIESLHNLATEADCALYLIVGDGVGEHVDEYILATGGSTADWSDIVHKFPTLPLERSTANAPATAPTAPAFPDKVPWVEFPLFRAMSRELLSPADFDVLDTTYRTVYRDARTTHPRDIEEVVDFLRTRFATARNSAEVITIARATQAACLINGNLLAVDPARVFDQAEKSRYRRLNQSDLDRLWGYEETWKPTVIVLHDAGLTHEPMHLLRIGDVKSAPLESLTPQPVAPNAEAFLTAHLEQRRHQGAREHDLFITQPKRTVDKLLTLANRHLNLPIDPSDGRDIRKATRWQYVNGIDFKDLT